MERIDGLDIQELAARFGTPTYVYSAERIRKNYSALHGALAAHYPTVRLQYAVKANMNLAVLRLLRSCGAGADCASPGEIHAARRAGFTAEEISYTGNYESPDDLAQVSELRGLVNMDDVTSFERLCRVRVPERISFRINPGLGRGAFEQINTGGEKSKFGVPFEKAEAAYRMARDRGVKRFGVHMMPGSSILDPTHFAQAARLLLDAVGPVFAKLGLPLDFVDVGGGFGIPYADHEHPLDLDAMASELAEAVTERLDRHGLGRPVLVTEPGRILVGNAGWLVSRVSAVKHSYRRFVGVDAGMTTLMRPALYGARHRVSVYGKKGTAMTADLCGPVCESSDFFGRDVPFPEGTQEGDLVVFSEAGAYGYAMSSDYNGRPRPAEVLIEEGQARVIRRRQTLDDILSLNQP
jgi:diaminopimelate decarboxylase